MLVLISADQHIDCAVASYYATRELDAALNPGGGPAGGA